MHQGNFKKTRTFQLDKAKSHLSFFSKGTVLHMELWMSGREERKNRKKKEKVQIVLGLHRLQRHFMSTFKSVSILNKHA